MSINRSRRITFEEVADLYNETRPGYPAALVEDVINLSELRPGAHLLEVGCGPGNATVLFAQRGYHLLGIELGPKLAEYARRSCRAFPHVTIVQSAFEDYPIEPHGFDLVFSADAFHWIPPEIGYPKMRNALKDTGSMALFWQFALDPQTGCSKAIDAVFRRVAPQFDNPQKSDTLDWLQAVIKQNFRSYCAMETVSVKTYDWSLAMSADFFVKQMRTYSGHRHMPEALRTRLYSEIEDVINNFGGSLEQPMQTILFHARLK